MLKSILSKFLCLASLSTVCFKACLLAHAFPFDPPQEMYLLPGLDALFHPVTTNNPEAQKFFNQGLVFKYAFNHDASYWSFQKAAKLDPEMAMAYWGMALALGKNINTPITPEREKIAYDNIQKALELSAKVTNNEKDYIQALAQRYTAEPNTDQNKLERAYKNAMQKLVNTYPDDLDAATLYAESILNLNPWHQWTQKGEPIGDVLEAVAALESVLIRAPEHLGANHYYIHAIEASKHPERALMSAERLRKLLPASGHILHMPSHIYILVGDYHQAALSNEEAVAADLEYIRQFGMDGYYPLHYLSHNYHFLAKAYSLEGCFNQALKAAQDLQAFYVPYYQEMPELEEYAMAPQWILLRFNRWEEVIKLKPFPDKMFLSNILLNFAKAYALASSGKLEEAKQEQQQFLASKGKISPDVPYGYNHAILILDIAEKQLNAKMAYAQGQMAEAINWLKKAIALQDTLSYDEPPDWYYSLRESLGGVLLENKKYLEAEEVFREDLSLHPRNGRSLFGLLESLKAQQKTTGIFWIQKEFEEAWKYSNQPLKITDLF